VYHLRKLILITLFVSPINFVLAQSVISETALEESTGEPTPPADRPQFEPASVAVPAGSTCVLQPEGNTDPGQSLTFNAEADGVARFQAVRATAPGSIEQLSLACTDSNGVATTYPVDLRSEQTFAPHPFDPVKANLELRPALTADPLSYTQEELLQAGYGLRPDPSANPDAYQRWLDAVSQPAYRLRAAARPASTVQSANQPSDPTGALPSDNSVTTNNYFPHLGWTGAELFGSFKQNETAAQTYSYVWNEATFNVPTVYPGGYGTGATSMDIWNGLGGNFLLQAIVNVTTTTATSKPTFAINHQDFGHAGSADTDEAGVDFTPNPGDSIYDEEWYCDAKGNLNLTGGYACTVMIDKTQQVEWECDQANNQACPSYKIKSANLANGILGTEAEYIIELETANLGPWPDTSPVTMIGSAFVAQGNGASGNGNWVTTNADSKVTTTPPANTRPDVKTNSQTTTDPLVQLDTDGNTQPFKRGDGHLLVTLPTGGVKWTELATNVYYWNGSNFNDFSIACALSIGVGQGSSQLPHGRPWISGCNPSAGFNHDVYEMQSDGTWLRMQADVADQVAVSPEGNAWVVNRAGEILYWDGDENEFVQNAFGGCATWIAVGPISPGLAHGTPWITGCSVARDGNRAVHQYGVNGWKVVQDDVAVEVAVSPEGNAWAINAAGQILYYNGEKFVVNPANGCATSIAVGPSTPELPYGTPWITGCSASADGNHDVYELQADGSWKKRQADVGTNLAVSPAGTPWAISTLAH